MLLQNVAKKYPRNYILLAPAKRDDTGRVQDWQVLNNDRNYQKIKDLADYYRREGIKNAVIISTAKTGMDVAPDESARFFRIFHNMFTIAGVSIKFPMTLGGEE
ncbi:MAG: hypothetical protein GX234_05405 [Clostridiales bacterium]|nr:hypothetical protein [Clostridiales bacterium]